MTFRLSLLLAAAAALAGAQAPALAQDVSADPNFGTVRLRSGFTPDPRVVPVQSGGDIDAESIDPSCACIQLQSMMISDTENSPAGAFAHEKFGNAGSVRSEAAQQFDL